MFTRPRSIAASAAAVLLASSWTAHAAPVTEVVDRSVFDPTPERTESTLRVDGPTSGPLGGAMEVTVRAVDGSLPTSFGSCEAVAVSGALTLEPGRTITVDTRGETCAHVVDGSLTTNAFFRQKNVEYEGFGTRRPRLLGDGLIAVAQSQLGGRASFLGTFRGLSATPR